MKGFKEGTVDGKKEEEEKKEMRKGNSFLKTSFFGYFYAELFLMEMYTCPLLPYTSCFHIRFIAIIISSDIRWCCCIENRLLFN